MNSVNKDVNNKSNLVKKKLKLNSKIIKLKRIKNGFTRKL